MGGVFSTDEWVSAAAASTSSPVAGGPTVEVKTDKSASAADLQKAANVVRLQLQAIFSDGQACQIVGYV